MKSIKHVNVGTVGHVDHGRVLQYTGHKGYESMLADYPSNAPSITRYRNPFTPEWIYWWNGLIYVGGRVIHNLRIYEEVETPRAEVGKMFPACDSITETHSKDYHRLKQMLAYRMNKGAVSGKMMPSEVVESIEDFMRPTPMKIKPMLIIRELERDRRTVIPSRGVIRWAIAMTQWDESAIMKIAGMTDNDLKGIK